MEAVEYLRQDENGQLYVDFDALALVAPSEFVRELKLYIDLGCVVLKISTSTSWRAYLEDQHSIYLVSHGQGENDSCVTFGFPKSSLDVFGYQKVGK